MGNVGKKEIMSLFENYLDEIMNEDRSKFSEMPQMIKSKIFDIGEKVLQNWSNEKIVNDINDNIITKNDGIIKKK
ncbi:MAG TPA: hypothetical protein PK771_07520 [Spirochaetota bacterium]|nr:hypothetical protein [Spirochaetota bacterium]